MYHLRAWVLPAIILMSWVIICPYCIVTNVNLGSFTSTSGYSNKLSKRGEGNSLPLFALVIKLIPAKHFKNIISRIENWWKWKNHEILKRVSSSNYTRSAYNPNLRNKAIDIIPYLILEHAISHVKDISEQY